MSREVVLAVRSILHMIDLIDNPEALLGNSFFCREAVFFLAHASEVRRKQCP